MASIAVETKADSLYQAAKAFANNEVGFFHKLTDKERLEWTRKVQRYILDNGKGKVADKAIEWALAGY